MPQEILPAKSVLKGELSEGGRWHVAGTSLRSYEAIFLSWI
jgi:hypothetical protein